MPYMRSGKIALQNSCAPGVAAIGHTLVAPSAIRAPINRFMPRELTHDEILQLIATSRIARNWRGKRATDGVG